MIKRATINSSIKINGCGLHNGIATSMKLIPSKCDTGIVFVRTDITNKNNVIKVDFKNVSETNFNSSIQNNDGVSVSTVEHILAALWYLEISDVIIEINASEVPTMDGASAFFINTISVAGKDKYDKDINTYRVSSIHTVKDGDSYIVAEPFAQGGLYVDFTVDFPCKEVGRQNFIFDSTKDSFYSNIAHAKTFAIKKDYERIKTIGLAKGGSLANAILLEEDVIHNPQGLKYHDDFARHKILDFIGDIYTSGFRIYGKFTCYKSGHKLNNELLRLML